jgi:hypothetical protein
VSSCTLDYVATHPQSGTSPFNPCFCRYWTGKAPDWAVEQAGDETRFVPPSSSIPRASSGHAKADPRLLRLGQKQQQSQSGRRHATEAIIVQRHPAPVAGSTTGEANVDSAGEAVYERAHEQDDDEIALRRLAIRSRQATESHGVHLDEEFQVWGQPLRHLPYINSLLSECCASMFDCPSIELPSQFQAGQRRHFSLHLGR